MAKMKLNLDEKIILYFYPLREIFDIFSSTFLTAYFVKISADSLQYLSIYNILVYFTLLIGSFVFGFIMKRNFKLQIMRLSILMNMVYFLAIIIMKEDIVHHLPLISFLLGFSASAYWMPMHSITGRRINNNHRTRYTSLCTLATQITNIAIPFLLGSLISASNFTIAAIVVLAISIFQIILSFLLSPEPKVATKSLNYKRLLSVIKKDKNTRIFMISNIFTGLAVSGSALKMLITVLIIEFYKTDFNLGVIASIAALISIISVDLYGNFFHKRNDKSVIIASCLFTVVSLSLFIYFKANILLIIFYVFYLISASLLRLMRGIRAYNVSDQQILSGLSSEYWSFSELFLNLGRIVGYSLLFVTSIYGGELGLIIVLILLTACMPINGFLIYKVKKFENGL